MKKGVTITTMTNDMQNEDTGTPAPREGVRLPEWFLANLPEHLPHSLISYADGEFHWSYDLSSHPTVQAAYDHARQFKDVTQVNLDKSLEGHGGHFPGGELGWMFFCDKDENTPRPRLLTSSSTEETVEAYSESYENWLTVLTPTYYSNPDNFVTAYQWLSSHPAFWVKSGAEKSFEWDTEYGLSDVSISVYLDDDGKTVVFLEHGIHLEDYTGHFHDPRIFAMSETFEESIILMGKKVRKAYGLDGTELPEQTSTGE